MKRKIKNKKGLMLPLVFGYGIIIKAQVIKIKKKLFSTKQMALISTIAFLLVGSLVFFSVNYYAKGATYGWVQSTWSGGADTSSVADHTNNQTNWTNYYSKDATIIADDELTLSGSSAGWTETDDVDFNAGTVTEMYVSGGAIQLKKPDGASCSSADECVGGFCTASVCASS